ncbi:MAG: hypothetical protein ABIQ10_14045 [Gemmatimonadaceae bacterium]
MTEFLPVIAQHDRAKAPNADDAQPYCCQRRAWVTPSLAGHSTLTALTQAPLPQPLSLLFLQSSTQCFDQNGNPVTPCPPA